MTITILRSPRYPNVSLPDAISKARSIYEKEHMSPLTPQVAAEAMGYGGLHGASLKMISSLKKYGLLEGRGEDVRLTKDAQVLVIDTPENPDYKAAVRRAALSPDVFADIHKQFRDGGSERNIAVFLEKQGYKPDAASTVARNYKETIALVGDDRAAYNDDEAQAPSEQMPPNATGVSSGLPRLTFHGGGEAVLPVSSGLRVVQDGKHLHITASVDLAGLRKLMKMLDKYESLLEIVGDQEGEESIGARNA